VLCISPVVLGNAHKHPKDLAISAVANNNIISPVITANSAIKNNIKQVIR